jgi:predicted metalloprotease with PDZ domain
MSGSSGCLAAAPLAALSLVAAAASGEPAAAASGEPAAPIAIRVDLSEAPRRIFHARLTIPAEAGPLTLVYPEWLPGEHAPSGPITDLAGLRISASGQSIPWRRDETDMFAFHCEVPAGASSVEISLDFLSPPTAEGFSSGASATTELAVFSWNQVLLYPKGALARTTTAEATLELPRGWSFGTALPVKSKAKGSVRFAPVSLETLVDSPVVAGAHFREIAIGLPDDAPHFIEVAADSERALEIPEETKAGYERLVEEAHALFGARHYETYRFLVALSDHIAHFGLEHHESSDNRMHERAFVDDDLRLAWAGLLPHELVHSWNGKHRRPADLTTQDFQQPMRDALLWVYEGLTTYLGDVLAARSALVTPEQFREQLALNAELVRNRRGRAWRSLEDTAIAAQLLYEARDEWSAWRRGVDFYPEGKLVWLEADVKIRELTGGSRSLDDFCRRFLGGESGPPSVRTYTLEDVVADLNAVAPFDWKGFFRERISEVTEKPPLAGIERAGWKLSYAEEPSSVQKAAEARLKTLDLSASLGLLVGRKKARIEDVIPGSAADRAGIAPGTRILAVNGRTYSREVLTDAVAATRSGRSLELLVESAGFVRSHVLEYREGARFPVLVRDEARPDLLSEIAAARVARPVPQ